MMAQVMEVRGQTALLKLGQFLLEAKSELPLAVGDRVLLTVAAKDERGLVLRIQPQAVSQALTEDDFAAILKENNLPKEAFPVAKALLETGSLDAGEIKTLFEQLKEAGGTPQDAKGASALFRLGIPLSPETLKWARRLEEGLAPLERKLQGLPPQERKRLEPWLERLKWEPKKGFKPFFEALQALGEEDPGIREEEKLASLADRPGPLGELAAELLGIFRFSQLSNRPRVPFLLEGGEGHLERDGERIRLELEFDQLGKIRVDLVQVEGRLSCLIQVDGAAGGLSPRLNELKARLEAQGYQPAIQVRVRPEGVQHVDLRL
ncbi:MAG: hypothetical protein ACM3YO_03970 [Bacteroidota bacterium]